MILGAVFIFMSLAMTSDRVWARSADQLRRRAAARRGRTPSSAWLLDTAWYRWCSVVVGVGLGVACIVFNVRI